MTHITSIDKNACKVIANEVEKALKEVAERLGLNVTLSGGKFDPSVGTYMPKVEFAVQGAARVDFEQSIKFLYSNRGDGAWLFAADYEAPITLKGEQFLLTGINLRKPKFAIEVTKVTTGEKYGITEEALKRALGR